MIAFHLPLWRPVSLSLAPPCFFQESNGGCVLGTYLRFMRAGVAGVRSAWAETCASMSWRTQRSV